MNTVPSVQSRYTSLSTDREPHLARAREASSLTIPALLPPEGSSGSTTLYQPWQSVGAEGVNNLASKLMLVLFPPDGTFFRYALSDAVMDALIKAAGDAGEEGKDVRGEIEEALGKIETSVSNRVDAVGARMQLFEAFKHLIVAGNCLIQILEDERLKLHKLDRYCIKRDQQGNVMEIVVKETVAKTTLPEALQALVEAHPRPSGEGPETLQSVDIYTYVKRVDTKWEVHQEIHGVKVPDSEGSYPLDKSPWIPLRFVSVDGEDYGRGFVEENIGTLRSYDSLMQALVEGSAIMSRVIFLRNPGGITQAQDLVRAPNGGVIDGQLSDIAALQVQKAMDLQVAWNTAADLKKDLQRAFLLFSGAQRQAERVTAEEIRTIVQELEVTFGGTYSVQSAELQLPLARRYIHQMTKRDEIPPLPDGVVNIQIVTGLAGLGRASEFNKIMLLMQDIQTIFGPDAVKEYIPVGAYVRRKATALAIDVSGMVRSDAQVEKSRQEAMAMELAKSAIGPMAKMQEQSQPMEG